MIEPRICFFVAAAIVFVLCIAHGTNKIVHGTYPKKPCHSLRDVKYVRLSRPSPSLEIAEVQVYDENGLNLAPLYGKPTQSSTWKNDIMKFGPQIAVNGNISGLEEKGEVAKTSGGDLKPYWELALPRHVAVSRVTVFLKDLSHHPNPESDFDPKKNLHIKLELLCSDRKRLWHKYLTFWQPIFDFKIPQK